MEPSAEEIIKPLVDKYALAVETKAESVIDDNIQSSSLKVVFELPFEGN